MGILYNPKVVTYGPHIATLMVYFWRMHVTDTQLLLTNVFEVTKLTENHTLTLLDKLLNN